MIVNQLAFDGNIVAQSGRVGTAHLNQLACREWWAVPPYKITNWAGAIRTQRFDLSRLLKQNPSLKRFIPEEMTDAYPDARELAAAETGKPVETFPAQCPFSIAEVLDKDFWPDQRGA